MATNTMSFAPNTCCHQVRGLKAASARRGQARVLAVGDPIGQQDGRRVEEEGDEARVEEPEGRAGYEVPGQHHQMGAGQIGVVPQDRVAAQGLPEAGGAGLPREHGARVVRSVGALALQDLLQGEGKLDHPAVLAVGAIGGHAQGDEGQGGQTDEKDTADPHERAPHANARARQGGAQIDKRQQGRDRGEHESDGVAIEDGGGGQEGPEPCGRVGQPRLVKEPPGQDAGRVVVDELAGHEQQQPGHDESIETRPAGGAALAGGYGLAGDRRQAIGRRRGVAF